MSQVIHTQNPATTNNANEAAISTPKDIDLALIVRKNAERKSKGTTLESWRLNKSALFSAVCAEYKSQRGMPQTARLDTEMAEKIDKACADFIQSKLNYLNAENTTSVRKFWKYDGKNKRVVEGINASGFNLVDLNAQKTGILALIEAAKRRLKDLEKKPNPDYDAEQKIKARITDMEMTEVYIRAQIADLNKVSES